MKVAFISVLKSFGFKQQVWSKCPQGFEKANYPCFYHTDLNYWAEVYKSDKPPYMLLEGHGVGQRGKFFDDSDSLKIFLKTKHPQGTI